MSRCEIGLIGWGTVGGGVVDVLTRERALLAKRCGREIALSAIVTRTPGRDRGVQAPVPVSSDPKTVINNPAITIVVLLVGGTTVAKDLCLAALRAGKHVVTANKAIIAEHGDELFAAARAAGVGLAFEAAVGGGIPIVAALRDGFVANRITALSAILNGTCNFILTKMEQERWGYAQALAEAQRLGYAEADPTLDVDGTDTAHKLAILARLAFGGSVALPGIGREGIDRLSAEDLASAARLGCRIKLLAVARQQAQGVVLRVAPTLVPLDHPLAAVSKNYNGISVTGSAAGPNLLVGQGAGALPTASAVVADIADVALGRYSLTARAAESLGAGQPVALLPSDAEVTAGYARLRVPDKAGTLAQVMTVFGRCGVSLRSVHQPEPSADGSATVEVLTHPIAFGQLRSALFEMDKEKITVAGSVVRPVLTP